MFDFAGGLKAKQRKKTHTHTQNQNVGKISANLSVGIFGTIALVLPCN